MDFLNEKQLTAEEKKSLDDFIFLASLSLGANKTEDKVVKIKVTKKGTTPDGLDDAHLDYSPTTDDFKYSSGMTGGVPLTSGIVSKIKRKYSKRNYKIVYNIIVFENKGSRKFSSYQVENKIESFIKNLDIDTFLQSIYIEHRHYDGVNELILGKDI